MAYTRPKQSPKCLKDGGSVGMKEQMNFRAQPHAVFQEHGLNMVTNKTAGVPVGKPVARKKGAK